MKATKKEIRHFSLIPTAKNHGNGGFRAVIAGVTHVPANVLFRFSPVTAYGFVWQR